MADAEVTPFERLLVVPLRAGINVPSRDRGTGVKLVNMGELFAYDRIGAVPMELAPLPDGEPGKFLLEEGDLLFARQSLTRAGAGKCSLVLKDLEPRTWEGHLIRARLNRSVAEPEYFYYWFRSPVGRAAIESIVEQVAAAGIRGSDLARLPVPVPTVAEQRAIAGVLGVLDDKIESNRRLAATARELGAAQLSSRMLRETREGVLGDFVSSIARGVAPRYADDDVSASTVLNQRCIRGGRVDLAAARRMESRTLSPERVAKRGDVLVNSTGGCPASC